MAFTVVYDACVLGLQLSAVYASTHTIGVARPGLTRYTSGA